jgi:Polyketide cyclase / dehydrase and lipid transport
MGSQIIQPEGDISMASIRKETLIDARPEDVWAAVRDVGAVHERLARGFVVAARLDGDARVVTFANGMVLRELIVDIDDEARRFSYAAVGGRLTHHNASIQVFGEGVAGSRIVWITDLLPNEFTALISELQDQGVSAMKQTLEAKSAPG